MTPPARCRARSGEAGLVLPELLLVMVVGLVLLSATLFTFERFITNANETDDANDTAEVARNTLEIEARQLRNVGKRGGKVTGAVLNRLLPDDIIFQTSDPTKTWVRYCLDLSQGTANGRLWQQTQPAVTPGTGTACPAPSGWNQTFLVGEHITNRHGGRAVPLFTYRCADGTAACTASSATYEQLVGVGTRLLVDTTPGREPAEMQLTSGVFLRNQNQAPVASFTSLGVAGQARTIQLNGSASSDFENRTLNFYWFLGSAPATSAINCDEPTETVNAADSSVRLWGGTFLGRGVVLRHTFAGTTPAVPFSQVIGLVVCDPGGVSGTVSKSVPVSS